jgi:hypothetical protein
VDELVDGWVEWREAGHGGAIEGMEGFEGACSGCCASAAGVRGRAVGSRPVGVSRQMGRSWGTSENSKTAKSSLKFLASWR